MASTRATEACPLGTEPRAREERRARENEKKNGSRVRVYSLSPSFAPSSCFALRFFLVAAGFLTRFALSLVLKSNECAQPELGPHRSDSDCDTNLYTLGVRVLFPEHSFIWYLPNQANVKHTTKTTKIITCPSQSATRACPPAQPLSCPARREPRNPPPLDRHL